MGERFQKLYRDTWIATAHGFGVLGNLIFFGLCYWEYGILMILWGSKTAALLLPFTLELILWFFAGVLMKQIIYDEQQAQLAILNRNLEAYKLSERRTSNQIEEKRLEIIQSEKLILLYGGIIPHSGISKYIIVTVVVIFLGFSISIITSNRNSSNKKQENSEVDIACKVIDSLAKNDIAAFKADIDAQVGSLSARSDAAEQKIKETRNRLESIKSEIENTAYLAVNRKSELYAEKKKIEKQLSALMDADNYSVAEADKKQEVTAYARKREETVKVDKKAAERSIRERHAAKNTGISILAVLTNILYLLFKYWIVKVRTITGEWTFDIFELAVRLIASIVKSKFTEDESNPSVQNEEKMPPPPTNTAAPPPPPIVVETPKVVEVVETPKAVKVVEEPPTIDELTQKFKERKIVSLQPKVGVVTKRKEEPTNKIEMVEKSSFQPMSIADFEKFMQEEGFEFEFCTATNIFDSVLKNGKAAIEKGNVSSDSVKKMNRLLDKLQAYEILIDPNNHTKRGGLVRVISQQQAA